MKKLLPIAALVGFSVLSLELFVRAGLAGWAVLAEPVALQVALDLCISWFFAGAWVRHDAKKHGISPTPFLCALPLVGAIAVLAYLVRRSFARDAAALVRPVASA